MHAAVDADWLDLRGEAPEDLEYRGNSEQLQYVWIALRTNMREVLETVTLAAISDARLPKRIQKLADNPESWVTR